jgi:hypothetical protein
VILLGAGHVKWQQRSMLEAFRVVQICTADGTPAPPEISERFQGRAWTKRQLEERGVRIAGAAIWYLSAGQDWQLTLEPA